ncbi:MAG: hypothetical protein IBJ07_05795 [Rhizobiaceae bacterium]|nr:hypothetical protein [Rhizobiaceae bacterium]
MLSRLSWTPPHEIRRPVARPRRINVDRRRHLVDTVATILKTGDPTPFAFEATCRHALRSKLCLEGWKWHEADSLSVEIVTTALNRIGARRPTWAEGQPEYVQNGAGALIERTRCIRCHKPLPEGHFKFCSFLCGQSHREIIGRRHTMSEERLVNTIVNPRRYSQWF